MSTNIENQNLNENQNKNENQNENLEISINEDKLNIPQQDDTDTDDLSSEDENITIILQPENLPRESTPIQTRKLGQPRAHKSIFEMRGFMRAGSLADPNYVLNCSGRHPDDPTKSIFEFDIDKAEKKPWLTPGVDLTDYFNYGFIPETWKKYCQEKIEAKQNNLHQKQIEVFAKTDKTKETKPKKINEQSNIPSNPPRFQVPPNSNDFNPMPFPFPFPFMLPPNLHPPSLKTTSQKPSNEKETITKNQENKQNKDDNKENTNQEISQKPKTENDPKNSVNDPKNQLKIETHPLQPPFLPNQLNHMFPHQNPIPFNFGPFPPFPQMRPPNFPQKPTEQDPRKRKYEPPQAKYNPQNESQYHSDGSRGRYAHEKPINFEREENEKKEINSNPHHTSRYDNTERFQSSNYDNKDRNPRSHFRDRKYINEREKFDEFKRRDDRDHSGHRSSNTSYHKNYEPNKNF